MPPALVAVDLLKIAVLFCVALIVIMLLAWPATVVFDRMRADCNTPVLS